MFNLEKLKERYETDPAFNKLVNVTTNLLKDHGFTPSEIREAQFYGQWLYEMSHAQKFIRTAEEQERFIEAVKALKMEFLQVPDNELMESPRRELRDGSGRIIGTVDYEGDL